MNSSAHDVSSYRSQNPPRQRRRSNEQSIKDSVVLVGSLMMIMSFGLILEANLQDNGWHASSGNKVAICVASVALVVFSCLFGTYMYFRMRKSCTRSELPQESQTVSSYM